MLHIRRPPDGFCIAPDTIAYAKVPGADSIAWRTQFKGCVLKFDNNSEESFLWIGWTFITKNWKYSTITFVRYLAILWAYFVCNFVVIIHTVVPELYGCPDDIITGTEQGTTYAIVSWYPPIAQGGTSTTTVTQVTNYTPGDAFNIGDTTVVYTLNDITLQVTINCSFVIEVKGKYCWLSVYDIIELTTPS